MDGESREETVEYGRSKDERPSEAMVSAVAAVTGQSPIELDPLWESIDPLALNRLFERSAEGSVSITFDYAEYRVAVREAVVTIRPVPAAEED